MNGEKNIIQPIDANRVKKNARNRRRNEGQVDMPTYEYVCKNCGYEFEKFQQMTEDHLKTCPECGKDALKRKIGAGSGVIFVGSGFYCNDYKGANASLGNPTSKKKPAASAAKPAKPAKK
jgi:putative FmdB family regulatory protein